MGQKVHPLGFRVGITKKHQSQWFARFQKYGYSQSVLEDHMLRKTLLNLFSNLEKENEQATKQAKKGNKPGSNASKTPKITQIKIERGLIPYEIGIQIHSDDCLAITKAIDNLKISKDLVSNLQKTRKYLFKAGAQLKNANSLDLQDENKVEHEAKPKNKSEAAGFGKQTKKRTFKLVKMRNAQNTTKTKSKTFFKARRKPKKKMSKAAFMRLKAIKRRLKKRQIIKKRYLDLIAKGLLIRKKGNLIIRKVKIQRKNKNLKTSLRNPVKTKDAPSPKGASYRPAVGQQATLDVSRADGSVGLHPINRTQALQRFSNRMYKKFAGLFLTKINKQFLVSLKNIMKYWHNQKTTYAPLGYSKKWSSAKCYTLTNHLKTKYLSSIRTSSGLKVLNTYQVEKLTKLIDILERKSLVKMESLRKDFITFGTLSKIRAFGYYQMITFLKQLKELVAKIKKQATVTTVNTRNATMPNAKSEASESSALLKQSKIKEKIQNLIKTKSKQKKSITQKVLNNFMSLVDNSQAMANECRKIKWISYLKNLVNKHRTENIYYYLATIADARKDLKNLKRYTKQHSNFLFGVNIENGKENTNALMQRVTKTLTQSSKNALSFNTPEQESSEGVTGLQKAFLTQIENQRKMYKANLALTPKISIKFFSVKTTDALEKASIVTDSIIDALEKRKAFRGVIKKAKEDLMRRTRVKGVKIQVSGRLNGAEIARSEWVRAGRVPLQTLRANIDYSYRTASTIYGIIGVKVWIFKGYSKMI
jgi:ribosomal protein S3